MDGFYSSQKETISHSSIVHELLKKIVTELGTREFRGGYKKPVINGGITYMDYIPDSRAEYIQSIEALSDILLPQYDEIMEEASEKYINAIKEIENNIEGEEIRMGDETHVKLVRKKLKLSRELFRELNLLLKRTNYLKAAAYSESDLDDDDDEVDID